MTAVEAELEPRRVLVGDLPSEHDCAGCGSTARVWVPVGLAAPEPCCRACAARVASEPAFRESLAAAHSEPVEDALPPLRRPAVSPPRVTGGRLSPRELGLRGAAALAARWAADPGFGEQHLQALLRGASARRTCGQCALVSNPGGIARHQKHSGHTGWEAVR